jgi:FixJ family two-component response regulator
MIQSVNNTPSTRTVAIVDDDPAVRNSLKFSLEVEGFKVRAYSGAADLLGDPAIADCGCIIIDQNMPAMNGLDTVASLRNRAISVPAILITSQPSEALMQRAAHAGVPIVEKPLLGNALVDRIRLAVTQGAARPTG